MNLHDRWQNYGIWPKFHYFI